MPQTSPRGIADRAASEMVNCHPDADGGVRLVKGNLYDNATLEDLSEIVIAAGEAAAGRHFYLGARGGGRATLTRQSTAPIPVSEIVEELSNTVVAGEPPKEAGSGAEANLARPPAPLVGYAAGEPGLAAANYHTAYSVIVRVRAPRGYGFGYYLRHTRLSLHTTRAVAAGQLLAQPLPDVGDYVKEAGSNVLIGLWVTSGSASGFRLHSVHNPRHTSGRPGQLVRIEKLPRAEPRASLGANTGTGDRIGRSAPSSNETALPRPGRPSVYQQRIPDPDVRTKTGTHAAFITWVKRQGREWVQTQAGVLSPYTDIREGTARELLIVPPRPAPTDADGYFCYVRRGTGIYLAERPNGKGRDFPWPLYENARFLWRTRNHLGGRPDYEPSSGDYPAVNNTGLDAPEEEMEAGSVEQVAQLPTGNYLAALSATDYEGRETPPGRASTVTKRVGELPYLMMAEPLNWIVNSGLSELDPAGKMINQPLASPGSRNGNNGDQVYGSDDEFSNHTTKVTVKADTTVSTNGIYRAEAPVSIHDPALGQLEATAGVSGMMHWVRRGSFQMVVGQFDGADNQISGHVIFRAYGAGPVSGYLTFVPAGGARGPGDIEYDPRTRYLQLRYDCIGDSGTNPGRDFYGSIVHRGIHPGRVRPRKIVESPEGQPEGNTPMNQAPFPAGPVGAIMEPLPAETVGVGYYPYSGAPDRPKNADGSYRERDSRSRRIYQIYYYAPADQRPDTANEYGPKRIRWAVLPGRTYTDAVYARYRDAGGVYQAPAQPFVLVGRGPISPQNPTGEVEIGCLFGEGVTGDADWADYPLTYTAPEGVYMVEVRSRNMGGGEFVFQEPCHSLGTVADRSQSYVSSGTLTAYLSDGRPSAVSPLGARRVQPGCAVEVPSGTSASVSYATTRDPYRVTFSADSTEPLTPPEAHIQRVSVRLSSDGTDTPRVPAGSPYYEYRAVTGLSKEAAVLLRADRSEYPGSVIVDGFREPSYTPGRTASTDPAGRVKRRSYGERVGRIREVTLLAFTEEAMVEIEEEAFEGDSYIEARSTGYQCRLIDPEIVFARGDDLAVRKAELAAGGMSEDYVWAASGIAAASFEVVSEEGIGEIAGGL